MTDDKMTDDKIMWIVGIVIVLGVTSAIGYGVLWSVESTIDYENLHNEIVTNSTFVDTLDCSTIKRDLRALELTPSIMKHDQVAQLTQDFEQIAKEKNCND
jgi:hypothetical protein